MLFRDREHEDKFGDILRHVVQQGPLHRAVYYLIALTHLPLESCYENETGEIKPEALLLGSLTPGERDALALAHDLLKQDDAHHAFRLLGSPKEWTPYYVEALRHYPDYDSIHYAKVFVIGEISGDCITKYRFPEECEALLFARCLYEQLDNEHLQIQVYFKNLDLTYLAGIEGGIRTHKLGKAPQRKTVRSVKEIENYKLRMELFVRYTALNLPIEYRAERSAFEWWEE